MEVAGQIWLETIRERPTAPRSCGRMPKPRIAIINVDRRNNSYRRCVERYRDVRGLKFVSCCCAKYRTSFAAIMGDFNVARDSHSDARVQWLTITKI